MTILRESLLFQWRDIDSADDLSRFLLVRDNLPDARLVDFLEKRRGKGRDDYPVRPIWNLVLAGVVFQHPSAAALLREASRNPALREACGFNPFPRKRLKKVEGKWVEVMEAEVPSDDAFGRFLALLIEHRSLIDDMFHACLDELAALLPDLGEKLAVDSKAIQSAGKPVKDEEKQETPDGRRDLDADWGKKEYKGTLCPGRAKCEKCAPDGVGPFGRVFRVPLSFDRRIFTPIARHTPKWENAYDRRTAVERVNARIDRVLGFELHFIRGQAKMEMRVSLALTVLLAMALGRIRANQADLMRSLTAKVQRTGA
jgi:hypothetical protein